jgi:hypothetical protein
VKPDVAIDELKKLRAEASPPGALRQSVLFTSWKARVDAVLNRTLGPHSTALRGFRSVNYKSRGIVASSSGRLSADQDSPWFIKGVQEALGYIDAAIYELGFLTGVDEPVDQRAFDAELWDHVKALVEAEDWGKVASQTAIFVEDRVRIWAGHPKDGRQEDLVGKNLWAAVLANDAEYRLGQRAGEWEGWRFLGMGFAQALSNVDRHRIQQRDDARRYAIGVLALGSLLLTQLRHEHGEILHGD